MRTSLTLEVRLLDTDNPQLMYSNHNTQG